MFVYFIMNKNNDIDSYITNAKNYSTFLYLKKITIVKTKAIVILHFPAIFITYASRSIGTSDYFKIPHTTTLNA